ncbi:MAG: sigma-54-dependent Fis family transcriptional regulator [Thermodesulfobacterium sp.]|nr:sigma-54-dependent Fis family transcriptional regulator [Thermodesulfobacterium sp.]
MRLDIRLKNPIKAFIPLKESGKKKKIILEGLSLRGALLKLPKDENFSKKDIVEILIPYQGIELKILAKKIRKSKDGIALEFLIIERETLLKLWKFICNNLYPVSWEVCPYCNSPINHNKICPNCKFSLEIFNPEYVFNHFKRTFLYRVKYLINQVKIDDLINLYLNLNKLLLPKKYYNENIEFVGTCKEMLKVFSLIRKVAPLNIPVLILGKSGTGKELVAQAIYEKSLRKDKPFIVINCAAIPETLLEAELFGYEKGAFTGAHTSKKGKVELANGGVLFLDEIGELPLSLQAKILRFLEDGTVERIGSEKSKKVDVRVIAATNRDLEEEVKNGNFRADLYYRLSVFTIKLPPLKERGNDKIILANYFLKKFGKEYGITSKQFSEDAKKAIMEYHWPGNVRELINKIRRALVLSENEKISPKDLGLDITLNPEFMETNTKKYKKIFIDRSKLLETLERCSFNISKTAKILNISRPTVYNLIKKYKINLH